MKINQNVLAVGLGALALVLVIGSWLIWGRGGGSVSAVDTEKAGRKKMEDEMRRRYMGAQNSGAAPGAPR